MFLFNLAFYLYTISSNFVFKFVSTYGTTRNIHTTINVFLHAGMTWRILTWCSLSLRQPTEKITRIWFSVRLQDATEWDISQEITQHTEGEPTKRQNLSTNLYESLWFCGLFDFAPKILRNCKQWAPLKKLQVMALLLVLVLCWLACSLQSEFELEGCKLSFEKEEIPLHYNLIQFGSIWHKNLSLWKNWLPEHRLVDL